MSRLAIRVARLVLAVLGVAAVGTGVWRAVQGGFDPVNYLSFFTIQTTAIAAVVLILAALRRPGSDRTGSIGGGAPRRST